MAAKKNVLGRGLGALIDVSEDQNRDLIHSPSAVNEIPVNNIAVNPFQPRTSFYEESMTELVMSVEEHGIIQPITVRRTPDNTYQLITGERRLRAAQKVGLKRIPAYVREAGDESMLELALVENIQREDLDAIEVAISYQRLIEEFSLTQERLGERVGKKRATIANYLRLLNLPVEVQTAIRGKKLSRSSPSGRWRAWPGEQGRLRRLRNPGRINGPTTKTSGSICPTILEPRSSLSEAIKVQAASLFPLNRMRTYNAS